MGIVSAIFGAATASKSDTLKTVGGTVTVKELAKLEHPWAMAYLPDGRLLVTEKPGQLRIFAGTRLSEPIAGVPAVAYRDQGGLLDVAVDPRFATNSTIYLSFVEAAADQSAAPKADGRDPRIGDGQKLDDNVIKGLAIARAKLAGDTLSSVEVIWRQTPKLVGRGHFGGHMAIASDGMMYVTSGDRQRFDPAQDMTGNVGKIVRIDPKGTVASNRAEGSDVWSAGHRNPLGLAFRPGTDELWSHEMGPKGGDELNLIVKGRDYGWPTVSDGDNYDDSKIARHATRPEFAAPIKSWSPVISPSGLLFYTGDAFPAWKGKMLIGGLSSKALIVVTLNGQNVASEERVETGRRIRDIAQTPDGGIVLLEDGEAGKLLRLIPPTSAAR